MKNTTKPSHLAERGKILKISGISLAVIIFLVFYYLVLRGRINLPNSLAVGPLSLHLYGLSIITGIFFVAYLVNREAKSFKWSKKLIIEDAIFYVIIPGLLGARLWHVFTDWHLYQNNLQAIFYIWNGGLGIYGGILGGIFGGYLYTRKQKLPFVQLLDITALFFPLAQIIGRFGNLVNQEVYGRQTDLPWGFYVRENLNYFHPAFLYEQLGNLLLFFVLYRLYKYGKLSPGNNNFPGSVFFIYLLGYAFVRFLVDFFRIEPKIYLGLTFAQFFSLMVMAGGIVFLVVRNKFPELKTINGKTAK